VVLNIHEEFFSLKTKDVKMLKVIVQIDRGQKGKKEDALQQEKKILYCRYACSYISNSFSKFAAIKKKYIL
jgi:hypothetical protein